MKNLILDANNLLYRTFYAEKKSGEDTETVIKVCINTTLTVMNYNFNRFKADQLVMAFDSRSWRKYYTDDLSKCVTNKKYKGHRRDDKTPEELKELKLLDTHMEDFHDILKEKTSVLTLKGDFLEADDLIGGFIQMHRDDENIVISSDKDFIQLLRHPQVSLIDPFSGKERTLEEWEYDPGLFLFEKCIRGEPKKSDNIQSSYPRLRKKQLVKAYRDDYERENVMNHTFKQVDLIDDDYVEVEFTTRDLFKENELLIDLSKQPKKIRVHIAKTIKAAKENRGKFNYLEFRRFCYRTDLHKLLENIDNFIPMLSGKSAL